MKSTYKKLLLVISLSFSFILTACGMTPEEIDTALTQLNTTYQNGTYEQAQTEVKALDKSYKRMSEEQKVKFDELKSSIEYATNSITMINDGLSKAQSFYDQKLYYEAHQELEKLIIGYKLPPREQAQYEEKRVLVDNGIKNWEITSTFQKVESLYINGDYTSAENTLLEMDISIMSEEQKLTQQSWQNKVSASKKLLQAERYYNNGSYTSALNTLSGIESSYLTPEQNQKYGTLKTKSESAIAEIERQKRELNSYIQNSNNSSNSWDEFINQQQKQDDVIDRMSDNIERNIRVLEEGGLAGMTFY